jgi:hypothetical protein
MRGKYFLLPGFLARRFMFLAFAPRAAFSFSRVVSEQGK